MRRIVLSGLLILLLGGCASAGRQVDAIPEDPAAIELFELNGRVNVRVKAENKSYPGKIRWQHHGIEDDLWIYTPLGNLVARLEQGEHEAAITNAQGESFRAGTLAFLARDVLGYDLPVEALQYWVRGLEWPQGRTGNLIRDDQGRTASLAQDKWQITYLAWTAKEGAALPTKLNVESDEMRLSLVIDQWKFRNIERE